MTEEIERWMMLAQHVRERAEETRSLAGQIHDVYAKDIALRIAADYDLLAQRADQLAADADLLEQERQRSS